MIDEGRMVAIIYIDFNKAIDKVPYGRLTQRIKMHLINGDLVVWFTDRRERVVL